MNNEFNRFIALSDDERRVAYDETADLLKTRSRYVEKDLWVCRVLDVLYNGLPDSSPRLLFKGGTSLSKGYNAIQRFSEDVDITVYREDLGFTGESDPTSAEELSNRQRKTQFEKLSSSCSEYILGTLADALSAVLGDECKIRSDDGDESRQTLLVEYATLFAEEARGGYVKPLVKLEGGARSALDPNSMCSIKPYVANELGDDWNLDVDNVRIIDPCRTFWDKQIILHGLHCGFRDEGRLPKGQRMSRHYSDAAVLLGTDIGRAAIEDRAMLDDVREYNSVTFKQRWKKLDEARPGSFRVVPQDGLRMELEKDYEAMRDMMFGEVPSFDWIVDQLEIAEEAINKL